MEAKKIQDLIDKTANDAWSKHEEELERKRHNLKQQRKLFEKERGKYTSKIKELGRTNAHLTKTLAEKNQKIKQQNKAVANALTKLAKIERVVKQYLGQASWDKVEYWMKRA